VNKNNARTVYFHAQHTVTNISVNVFYIYNFYVPFLDIPHPCHLIANDMLSLLINILALCESISPYPLKRLQAPPVHNRHSSGGWSLVSHHGVPGVSPGQVIWDVWWKKWHWDGFLRGLRFPLPVIIPPTAPHSSSITRGWYNKPH
jgi:hypothetical protein